MHLSHTNPQSKEKIYRSHRAICFVIFFSCRLYYIEVSFVIVFLVYYLKQKLSSFLGFHAKMDQNEPNPYGATPEIRLSVYLSR